MSHPDRRTQLMDLLDRQQAAPLVEIAALVEADREILQPTSTTSAEHVGDSPLHIAIRRNCPDEVILLLLRAYPDAARVVDSIHGLPVRSALHPVSRVSPHVIYELYTVYPVMQEDCSPYCNLFFWALAERSDLAQYMIHKHPQLASTTSSSQHACYPIHVSAVLHDRPTVELLLQKFPPGLHKTDAEGRLPLHLIFSNSPHFTEDMVEIGANNHHHRLDLDLFQFLADQMDPDVFRTRNAVTGQLFLHELASGEYKVSMDAAATQAVIDRYPAAVMTPDHDGNLPIHIAVSDDDEAVDFIQTLIRAAPECLQTPNELGRLPMHAASRRFMMTVMGDLIEGFPQAIVTADWNGQCPLHIMLDADMFDRINAQRMVQLYPEILTMKDHRGRLPLHYALDDCQYYEAFDWHEGIDLLTKEYPEACLVHDNEGKTPFHCAATFGMPLEVAETLIERCSSAIFVPDREGNIPLIMAADACYSRHEEARFSIIYLLVRHNPSLLMALAKRCVDSHGNYDEQKMEEAPTYSRKRKLSNARPVNKFTGSP